jgi:hypothetical protein
MFITISLRKNLKLAFVLLFSSATIFFSKAVCAQIPANTLELDSLNSNGKLNLSPISEAENNNQTLRVADLAQNNSQFPSCPTSHTGQQEFNAVTDLDKINSQLKSCPPNRISQTESNPRQLDPLKPPSDPQPQVDELEVEQISPSKEPPQIDQNYIIPPRVADPQKIRPRTTSIPLNGVLINHLTQGQLGVGSSFSNLQNTTFNVNGIIKLNSQVQENLTTNNIFTVDQTGEYLQLQTVRQTREIIVNLQEPQTVLGTDLQLSLTASCILPDTNPDDICTYTPGLTSTDINPDTLIPNRIFQTATVGDVVAPETLAAIQQPGFQSGANGQEIGINLSLPNTGSFLGNSTGNQLSITRREEIENTPAAVYSRIRQVIKVNDREAVIGRTVRGFGFILNDENTLLNTALQLGYSLFPDINPSIAGSANRVNSNVNNNLFLAANNVRLPANSFTAYHGGIGRAQSVPPKATNLTQIPAANFNGIWLGASPVIKRSSELSRRFEQISPQTVLSEGGEEGGFDSNVSFVSSINNQNFSTAELQNFYAQVYVTILNQEVNNVTSNRYREATQYVPHLSFTGNITGTQDVLRYYTGIIGADQIKAYGGADFTKNTSNGWSFSGGIIAYVNPDVDYYSQVLGNIAKRIPLSQNSNLVLSTGVNYAFDRETRPNDFVNSLTLRTRVNLGNTWLALTSYVGDVVPDSIKNTLVTSLGIQFNRNFAVSAYYAPINENAGRSVYGTTASFTLGQNQNSPTLNLSWRNNEYDYGTDSFGNQLAAKENIFSVFVRGRF